MANGEIYSKGDLRRAFFDMLNGQIELVHRLMNSGEKYEEALYNAHDFAEFAGEYLERVGVLTHAEVETAVTRVDEVEA